MSELVWSAGCCGLEDGHGGPCTWRCGDCNGDGLCPNCRGFYDFGCGECDGTGYCLMCDEGWVSE